MKKLILSLLVVVSFSAMQAQITDDDYKSLLPYLKAENWKGAYKKSTKMLKNVDDDSSENAALVRFVNFYSAAGMVKQGKMEFEKMKQIAQQWKGKNMLSADFVASMNPQNTLNKTFFSNFDGANKGFTTVTDKFGKIILFLEYDFVKSIDPKALHGTIVSCGGVMNDIEVNPQMKTDWIIKIKVSNAFIR
ncbi:MAG: hypothetical protein JXQ69_05535 [Paludibacteraceae bacterium]|nr:hypothetical protein [Paludibacteraceae bacterium]MBN2787774.1 hypothetical protein [Paludibacteraceae bacterium]